jgi:acyl-CoA synthetase (AMP-forming)/AMP-acid ligase II
MATTLPQILLEHYGRHPDRLCVRCIFRSGERADVTYRALIERGSQFARGLHDVGAAAGSIAIVILPHSVDLYCAFFGAMLGAQIPSMLAVPSFKLNPHHYRHELEALLDRIDAAAVITDGPTAEHLGFTNETVGRTSLLLADRMAPSRHEVPTPAASPDDILLLQHSSGSTGLKKGVALSHRSVLDHIDAYAAEIELGEDDRIASWLPLYHDMGLIACAMMPIVRGIPVTALSPLHWVTSPGSLLHAIHQDRCTLAWQPNFAYEFLASRVRDSQIPGVRLESMRAWINCSEPTIAQTHRRVLARFGRLGVRPETLWTCYAAAETTFAISQSSAVVPARVERLEREAFLARGEALPVSTPGTPALEVMSGGRLLSNTEVRILDDAGNELPERRVGEIAIRSSSLFSGYFRDTESTAKALRAGWYWSGDMGYRADGHLFITGRKKDLIIIAGRNYYPQDIERIVSDVAGIHPGRVVALGVDDPALGTQRLVVLAEVAEPALVDDPTLAAHVRKTLSEHLDCVIDDLRLLPHMWLLKTSSGKIARSPNLGRYLDELNTTARPGAPHAS